jgi:succinate dehydrogenase / fumarate reductase flavoprotein subunit
MMGGIPTDDEGRVLKKNPIPGLYSAGETACVSVHGANRLGCNSLIDLVVFGKRVGESMSKFVKRVDWPNFTGKTEASSEKLIEKILSLNGNERVPKIRAEMQALMSEKCSIFRDRNRLEEALEELADLQRRYENLGIVSKGRIHNYELKEALELKNMLTISEVILQSAFTREESRGAHYRTDFPKRDDNNWLKHTQITKTSNGLEISYKPVTITKFKPKERVY